MPQSTSSPTAMAVGSGSMKNYRETTEKQGGERGKGNASSPWCFRATSRGRAANDEVGRPETKMLTPAPKAVRRPGGDHTHRVLTKQRENKGRVSANRKTQTEGELGDDRKPQPAGSSSTKLETRHGQHHRLQREEEDTRVGSEFAGDELNSDVTPISER